MTETDPHGENNSTTDTKRKRNEEFQPQLPEVHRENVIGYFWGMYENRREPMAIEPYQNIFDAFGDNNISDETEFSQEAVNISVSVDSTKNKYVVVDDAGGFTESGWNHLTTIGDSDKKDRSGAGSMGIGIWATAHLARYVVIETRTEEGDHRAIVICGGRHENTTQYFDAEGREEIELLYDQFDEIDGGIRNNEEHAGTYFAVYGVRDSSIKTLADADEFEDILAYHFPVFASDKVNIDVTIDGKQEEMNFTHLEDTLGEVFVDGETQTFVDNEFGIKRELRDITVAEAAETPPWRNGVALFKTHEFYDLPQMLVETYNAHVDGVMGDNPDMVAWAVADDLCREPNLEDPSHQRFNVNFHDETNLKQPVWEVWREHFSNETSAEEEEEKLDQIRNNLDEMLSMAEELSDDHISSELGGMIQTDDGGTGDSRLLICTPHLEEFDTRNVEIGFKIYSPPEPDCDKYLIRNATISHQGGEWERELDNRVVDAEDDAVIREWETLEVPEDGFYVFDAEIVEVPVWTQDIDTWQQSQTLTILLKHFSL